MVSQLDTPTKMEVLLLIFAGIAFGWCDKLDRTYLPPPGSMYSGGSAGDIQTPLELPKEPPFPGSFVPFGQRLGNQMPTGPSNGPSIGINQQNLQGFGQPELGQDLISQSPFVPSQQAPQNNFQGNLNLPTTTNSYAFTQTTTYPPDFESVTGSPGSLLDSQRIAQQFPNVNIPGQSSYPLGSGIPNQGSAYDQQGPSNAQEIPTYGPKPQDVQQGYQAPNSQSLNPNFIKNQVQSNQGFVLSPKPTSSQYGTQTKDQSQQYLDHNIPLGSSASIPGSQNGVKANHVQQSARPSSETPQSPAFNRYQGPFNNVQPSGVPSFPTSQTSLQNQFQNVGPDKKLQPSATLGFVTPQRPIQNNQYQSYRANQPVLEDNQNRFLPTGATGSNSNVALNGPAYSQLGSENVNQNVANYGGSQRYNPNIPSSAFDQPSSTLSPINFASSTASTFSREINSPSTPTYSNRQIQQQNVPSSRPERIQAVADRDAYILNYENIRTPEGFSYSFDTSNGIHADESGTATDGVKATGSYSYTGDDGKMYRVVYTADENGFLPHGDHLPTPPPIPEAILRVIEQANKDKEAGVIPDDGSYDVDKYGGKEHQGAMGMKQKYKPHMEEMLSKNRTATPQQENNFPISRKGEGLSFSSLQDNKEDYNDQTRPEKSNQDTTAPEDYDIEDVENIDTVSPLEKPVSDELKSNYNRKQENKMQKSSKKPLRPKMYTNDDLEEHDNLETSIASDRKPSINQSTNVSQRKQNQYQRPGKKDHRRPSSKNSNVRNKVPPSTTARYEDEDSKFNGNPYLPDRSSKNRYNDEGYESNEDTDSYDQADLENADEEDDNIDHLRPSSRTNKVKYPIDKVRGKVKPSLQNDFVIKNQRSRIRLQNPDSNRRRPSNEDIFDNDRIMDSEYQKESMIPSASANNRERNDFNQRNQPSRKQSAYSTQRPFENNQGQESGYEYNPPQKPLTQKSPSYPSISIPQKSGAESSSATKVPESISNEYEQNIPINQPSGLSPNQYKNQRITSRPITTAYPGFETPENEPGTTRGPKFGQKLQENTLPQYNQKVSSIGNNIYNSQINSQTPTQGQTKDNEFISSTTPLPRIPSTFGPTSTPQGGSQYNQDNMNQYSTTSKPFASSNQYYQPSGDSNITRISVLRPTYLPTATDPKDNSRVNGFDRPGLLQPTFGRVSSTTYRPNYSIIDNATPGSTPELVLDESTPKYMGEFVAPSQFDVKQPSSSFMSESQRGAARPPVFSSDRNIIAQTTSPIYQHGFEQSYQQNAPGVTPGVTPGPTYGPYPSKNGVIPTTERSQYQGFHQQQRLTSVPILGDQQENTRVGYYKPTQGFGLTPDSQINDGAMNQQSYQPPVNSQTFGPNQVLRTNVGPTRPYGPFQGSNIVAGEDFSGPKQPQYFDPETGYHY